MAIVVPVQAATVRPWCTCLTGAAGVIDRLRWLLVSAGHGFLTSAAGQGLLGTGWPEPLCLVKVLCAHRGRRASNGPRCPFLIGRSEGSVVGSRPASMAFHRPAGSSGLTAVTGAASRRNRSVRPGHRPLRSTVSTPPAQHQSPGAGVHPRPDRRPQHDGVEQADVEHLLPDQGRARRPPEQPDQHQAEAQQAQQRPHRPAAAHPEHQHQQGARQHGQRERLGQATGDLVPRERHAHRSTGRPRPRLGARDQGQPGSRQQDRKGQRAAAHGRNA